MAEDGTPEPDGIAARLSRMALGPARAAARSGREALSTEAERAVDGLLSGPLPETVARSLVEHHVLERALAEWFESMSAQQGPSPERDRLAQACERALTSPAVEKQVADLVERVVHSAAFERALVAALGSPEVRSALTQQTASFGAELADAVRRPFRRLDDRIDAGLRRLLHRRTVDTSGYGGLAARGLAIVVDLVIAHAAFLFLAGSVALVASLVGDLRSGWLAGSIAGAAWAVVVVTYFVVFWSSTGQTPGMRLLHLRVLTGLETPPSVWRSLVRFAGLILAIIPMFLGFAPVLFDGRRRAFQDYVAGTVVRAD
jgi:uncharacterized RDD family membrane protein YckC